MPKRRTFRFGTGCYTASETRSAYVDSVRRVEQLGYSVLVCPDHFEDWFGALPSLMMAAEASSTLRLGTLVLANDFRHPAVLAKEAATLDVLSDGRFELGLGAGDAESDYTQSGIAFDPPGVRVSRLEESVQAIKGLFGDAPFDFSGTYYTITGLDGTPKPLQRPHPPVLLAGGRKRMLSIAGREADIVGLVPPWGDGGLAFSKADLATTRQQIEWVREAAGDRFPALELNTLIFKLVLTDHPREAAELIAGPLGISPEVVLESIYFLVGTVDAIVEEIQMWRERFGISYVTVMEELSDAFAPVVARLAGT